MISSIALVFDPDHTIPNGPIMTSERLLQWRTPKPKRRAVELMHDLAEKVPTTSQYVGLVNYGGTSILSPTTVEPASTTAENAVTSAILALSYKQPN